MFKDFDKYKFGEMVKSGKVKPLLRGQKGRYYASRNGEIFSDRTDSVRVIDPTQNRLGIWHIAILTNQGFLSYDVADLVYEAFTNEHLERNDLKAMYEDKNTDNYAFGNLKKVSQQDFSMDVIRCYSESLRKAEEELRRAKIDNSTIHSSEYHQEFEYNEEAFDIMINAMMPFYKAMENIDCNSINPDEPALLMSTGESSEINNRDVKRLQEFYKSLHRKKDENDKNVAKQI